MRIFDTLTADCREMFTEQIEYRELLYQMTVRDLRLRYKQTVMGLGWALFMPLVNTAVFSVIFTRVAPLDTGVPYPLFAFTGLLVWNFFAASLRFAVNSLSSNATLVSKVYFPREIFPFSAVIVSLVDLFVAAIVLVVMLVYYEVGVGAALLWLPAVLMVHVTFTTAIALLLAMGNLFYRDVKYIFEIAITVWMFATSVVYPVTLVGGRLGTALRLNPMTAIVDAYRDVVLHNRAPDALAFSSVALLSLALLMLAWLRFHRAEFSFAENV